MNSWEWLKEIQMRTEMGEPNHNLTRTRSNAVPWQKPRSKKRKK